MTSASTETVYPIKLGNNALQLTGIIQQVIQAEINGRLCLETELGQQWELFFQLGRIVWASGGEHRFRRWHRVLRQLSISPASITMRQQELPDQWEHLVLSVLLKRNCLKREGVQGAIATNISEVLFDVLQAAPYIHQLSCNASQKKIDDSPVTILGTPDDLLTQARNVLKTWVELGLGNYSPNFAPVINSHQALKQHASPQMYVILASALTGKAALRDIAQIKRQPLIALGQFLAPYVQKELLAFQPIADFPPPLPKYMEQGAQRGGDRRTSPSPSPPAAPAAPPSGPLVVCIDDSPQVGYILEQVLVPLGYQILNIQDPIQALSTLMRRPPDFIFLDLVMPVVNGYELCGQIRRISALKETPIAILTGNDGVVDRVRAKMAGATDFLGKPVVPEKVLAVLQKHVAYRPAPMAASKVA